MKPTHEEISERLKSVWVLDLGILLDLAAAEGRRVVKSPFCAPVKLKDLIAARDSVINFLQGGGL